ncbi:ribonuclease H-like domain-containing protein [Tanacetum coccineum]|uniref:Ribonuclease H-like domain-containing protein n=1 Tax=Tanacetum coccineum TaxID=301880 RepID=A0ABQ5I176_9ASTR
MFVCYMHDPSEPHFLALRPILSYVRGTLDLGFQLDATFTGYLVAYLDADWTGCQTTRLAETAWLRNLLRELHTPLLSATLVYCDNGQVRVLRVPSHYQYADIFTKGLSSALFEDFHASLHSFPLKLLGCVMRIVCL